MFIKNLECMHECNMENFPAGSTRVRKKNRTYLCESFHEDFHFEVCKATLEFCKKYLHLSIQKHSEMKNMKKKSK